MDIPAPGQQSDDQELAKALAGVDEQLNSASVDLDSALSFEETAGQSGPVAASPFAAPTPAPTPSKHKTSAAASTPAADDSDLESIKKSALDELRPLVDKLDVAPEEKFDTYLMLLRSTDDKALIAPAHDAAKAIEDEARRAQALLDVVKEIDYLTSKTAS